MINQTYIYSLILIPTEKSRFFDGEEFFIKVVTALKKTAAACQWHVDDLMHDDDYVYITVQVPLEVSVEQLVDILYSDTETSLKMPALWSGDYTVRAVRKG